MAIDLHTHTTFSDGTDSPAELLAAAVAAGLSTVAVTDHDTADGWPAAAAALTGLDAPLTLLRGAELSAHRALGGRRVSIHLLAYLFDPAAPALVAEFARLRQARRERGMAIVDRMVAAGLPVSRQQVLELAGHAPIGRPHIGRALVRAGLVNTVTEAFTTYLSWRGPYYVPKPDAEVVAAVAMIREAGGVPVIAHPRSRGAATATDEATLARWVDAGLAGVEVDHPDHDAAARAVLRALAARLGWIVTGSSDYHGTNKAVRLGQERSVPAAVAAIVAASSGVTPPLGPGR